MITQIFYVLSKRETWVQYVIQAETYGQFADTSTRVSQEKDKQKAVEKKRRIKEVTYYRQGAYNTYPLGK